MEKYINKILHGDCLEIMKQMPDKSIDLILTDPPYGIDIGSMGFTTNTKGGVAKRNDYKGMADWDKITPSKEVFEQIVRISKKQVIFGGQYFTDKLPPRGCWVVWDKRTEDKYSNDFADCELAWTSEDSPSRIVRYLWSGMLQGDMKNKEKRFHPTQKPIEVISQIVDLFSKEGDLILDPYAGSCTLAIACTNLKRNYICIEKQEQYIKVCNERIGSLTTSLF